MPWGKPQKGGWSPTSGSSSSEREGGISFRQIIHTVLEVVAGGCIRAGKTAWDDDGHTGFWLGVCGDGVARFSVGGPSLWLRWDGETLRILGNIWVKGGQEGPNWLQFIGDDGETCGYMLSHDAWGHQIEIGAPIPHYDSDGDPAMIDLFADGDFGASVRVRMVTYRHQGKDGTRFSVIVGNQEAFAVDGYGNVIANSYLTVPDAVAPAQAVNLQTADARYAGSSHTHSLGQLTQSGAEVGQVAAWNGASWAPAAAGGASDHGTLQGLGDDDHSQYHTDGRGDARYSLLGHAHPAADHGALSGLGDDDHSQYHTDARGDARYLVKTAGVTKTVQVGTGRTMTFVNGQLTGTTGL